MGRKLINAYLLLCCIGALSACGESLEDRNKRCLEQAAEQCGPTARKECDLSGAGSSRPELERCEPYMACEKLAVLGCMGRM